MELVLLKQSSNVHYILCINGLLMMFAHPIKMSSVDLSKS